MAGAGAAPVRQHTFHGNSARADAPPEPRHGDGTHVAETTSSTVRGPDTHQEEPAPRAGHVKSAPSGTPNLAELDLESGARIAEIAACPELYGRYRQHWRHRSRASWRSWIPHLPHLELRAWPCG